jgi:hypothetical protein
MFYPMETRGHDFSKLIGGTIVIFGLLLLLQNIGFGLFGTLITLFWVAAFTLGGIAFLYVFILDQNNWWALIPGFALLGLAMLVGLGLIAPRYAEIVGAPIFLGSISLGFLAIYVVRRGYWWAIIPGGILMSIASMVFLEVAFPGTEWVGVMFLGMAATFVLLMILPTGQQMTWALIPAGIFFLLGAFLLLPSFGEAPMAILGTLGPLALVVVGVYVLFRALRSK